MLGRIAFALLIWPVVVLADGPQKAWRDLPPYIRGGAA
jgi:hypothetical protein